MHEIDRGYALLREGRVPEAARHAEWLLAQRGEDVAVLVFASEARLAAGVPEAALALLQQAIEASGGDARLQLKQASLLAHQRRRDAALQAVAAAVAARPDDGRIQWQAGAMASHCNQPARALHYYAAARSLLGEVPPLLYDTAVAQFFTGDFDTAEANLDLLLSKVPDAGHAVYLRSTLRRQTAERNHVDDLRRRAGQRSGNAEARAATLYALAKELEDLGDHPRAFATLSQAAATKRGTLRYDIAAETASLGSLMEAYTRQAMETGTPGHRDAGVIFIVGMPRTGTTLVERLLVQQGTVASAGELLDFGNLVALHTQRILHADSDERPARASLGMDFAALGREYLRGAREAAGGSTRFIDKMPVNYLYCGLIRKALPDARIIHLRRDPLDCCYAVYKTLFFNAYHFSYDLAELAEYYLAYERMMRHWHEVMPGAILDVDYEALVSDTESQARRIFEWCGLPWDPAVLETHPDRAAFATASAAQVREPVHRRSVRSSRRHMEGLAPLVDRLRAGGIMID